MEPAKIYTKKHYLDFEAAREFVHGLNFETRKEYQAWAKTSSRPSDIPRDPESIYARRGWICWGDWLGTHRVANQNLVFRPFSEARSFSRSLGLKSSTDWRVWAKTKAKPDDIPAGPAQTYKDCGWKGWGDWLGTDRVANQNRNYRPFKDARDFVRSLELKNGNEWRRYVRSGQCPIDIPANPYQTYRDGGWLSMGDWLGNGAIANQDRTFRAFEDARVFVQSLELKNRDEWLKYARSSICAADIPACPEHVYKESGWKGMGDWLGTGRIADWQKKFRPFNEAKGFAHTLGLNSREEWKAFAKSGNRPRDIPVDPFGAYRDAGWNGWGDWLGTNRVANQRRSYRPFLNAREYARSLHFLNQAEWRQWAKTDSRPDDIPSNPAETYEDSWHGWGDWLGIFNLWNKNAVISFLKSIEPILSTLAPIELFAIIRKNGMLSSLKQGSSNVSHILKGLRDACSSANPQAAFQDLLNTIDQEIAPPDFAPQDDDIQIDDGIALEESSTGNELPHFHSILKAIDDVDFLASSGHVPDDETIEFLVTNRVSALWQKVLDQPSAVDLEELRNRVGGVYSKTIRNRFFSQYDGACALKIPDGYSFQRNGKILEPNLMQRLTAYRVKTEKRIGNWSGVGAGKTISAILSSRVVDAKLTIIIAFNSTIEGWNQAIKDVFPLSNVFNRNIDGFEPSNSAPNYVLLNFEKFQQPDSIQLVKRLTEMHQIDFVVLDEIQHVKQRDRKIESLRRQLVKALLSKAAEKNPDLRVLGMSATPVINNLHEGKALLEVVKGVEFADVEVANTISNASALHEKLMLHGIRYKPSYSQKITAHYPQIDGQSLIPSLIGVNSILATERILVEAKLDAVVSLVKKGTLIYSHYKTEIIPLLQEAIRRSGFTCGLFTGDEKEGKKDFIDKKIDVLIGTAPIGTGVDGLQYICNRLIIVSLPWTAAEYEQLIGRLYRQNSQFDEIEVFVPQVVLNHNGDEWSWDKGRMNRIEYKKTLADAALDGVIPEGILESSGSMFDRAREALLVWIKRVEEEGVLTISREKLKVPLPEDDLVRAIRRFGDFSTMNARINSSNSETTHLLFKADPTEWYLYHTLYRRARETWDEIPFEKIADSLRQRPDWIIGDFGCGEANLAEILPNKVYSFDHVAINENVIACDMKSVLLGDGSLDVAVFSLSLMGKNYADYLKEAYRVLRFGGLLKIAEPAGRWENATNELLHSIREAGFQISGEVAWMNRFIYVNANKL